MKVKVGTVLDRELLRRARSVAAQEGKRLNQVIEAALSEYLKRRSAGKTGTVAERTAGLLKVSKRTLDRILREEPGLLDR